MWKGSDMKMNQTSTTATAPTTAEKINEAASALGARWAGSECVYFDDSTRKNYRCDDEDEMIDLYDLLHSDDEDVRRDAYSHWCAQTSHEEID